MQRSNGCSWCGIQMSATCSMPIIAAFLLFFFRFRIICFMPCFILSRCCYTVVPKTISLGRNLGRKSTGRFDHGESERRGRRSVSVWPRKRLTSVKGRISRILSTKCLITLRNRLMYIESGHQFPEKKPKRHTYEGSYEVASTEALDDFDLFCSRFLFGTSHLWI